MTASRLSAVRDIAQRYLDLPDLDAIDLDDARRQAETGRRMQTLTPRERQVLQLLASGMTNKAMGSVLGISVRTIETHRSRVMQKMAVGSVAQLVRTLDYHC